MQKKKKITQAEAHLILFSIQLKFGSAYIFFGPSQVALVVKTLYPNHHQCRRCKRCGFKLWVGRFPGGGHGNLLQYSWLENSMDKEAWQATVHMSVKSWTWLKWLSRHTYILYISSPQNFWHQGAVLWKKIFPWLRWGDLFGDDSNTLHLLCTLLLLLFCCDI